MKIQATLLSLAIALGASTAYAGEYSCGCYTPPPVKGKVKANSGVGNGAEVYVDTGNITEANDIDPGNSQLNNQAGKNSAKPNSPRALTVNIIP